MLLYWAKDLFRSWSKRAAALFIVLSMLLSNIVSIADTDNTAKDEQILICGMTQHEHTEACYEDVLICGKEEPDTTNPVTDSTDPADDGTETDDHHHDEHCYEHKLTCGLEEHVHTQACYITATEPGEPAEEKEPEQNKTDDDDSPMNQNPEDQQGTITLPESANNDGTPEMDKTEDSSENGQDRTEQNAEAATGNQEPAESKDTAGTAETPETTDTPETADNQTPVNSPETSDGTGAAKSADLTDAAGTANNTDAANVTDSAGAPDNGNNEDAAETAQAELPAFETDGTTLTRYNGDEEVVTIPDGIKKIGQKAFYGNKTISTAVLPDSVEVINSSAFAECTNLEKVIITEQSRLATIGMAAFKNDTKLDISFAANVKHVVGNAFEGVMKEETGEVTPEEPTEETEEEPKEDSAKPETPKEETTKEETTGNEPTTKDNTSEEAVTEEETDVEEPSAEEDITKAETTGEEPEETKIEEPAEDEKADQDDEPADEAVPEDNALTIPSDEDAPYQVSVTFSVDAGIPEGTELVVTEAGAAENGSEEASAPKRNALKSGKKATLRSAAPVEPHADIPSLTSWNASEEAPDIILWRKTLDISLVSEGKEIEPNPEAKITVSVTLPEIEDSQDIEVRHITSEGAELLESTNNAGTVTFTTGSFSLFEFTSKAQNLGSWTSDLLENTFFGKTTNQDTSHTAISVENDTEGLTVLEAFTVTRSTDLWMTLQRIKDFVVGKLESIVLYTVEDGRLGSIVRDNISLTDVLRFSLSDVSSFALVRDSGLRRRIEDFGNVLLNGMLPKNATAEATDVTEAYEDFKLYEQTVAAYDITITDNGEEYQPEDNPVTVTLQDEQISEALEQGKSLRLWHIIDENTREEITDFTAENGSVIFEASGFSAYVLTYSIDKIITLDSETYKVTVSYGEDAEIPEGAELEIQPADAGEYLNDVKTALNWNEKDVVFYTKFLDISIVKDGEEVRPKAPVSVSIRLLDVTDGAEQLRVVHFGEDGAEELTANASEEAEVTFETESFSVFGIGNALHEVHEAENDLTTVKILSFDMTTASAEDKQGGTTEEEQREIPEEPSEQSQEEIPEVQEENYAEQGLPAQNDGEQNANYGLEEGLELVQIISVDNSSSLWLKASLKANTALTDMESVAVYSMENDAVSENLITEELTETDQLFALENTSSIAIVKDTGYRRLSFAVNLDHPDKDGTVSDEAGENTEETEKSNESGEEASSEDRIITLNGMMPKAADATIADVTEEYADHEYAVPEEEGEEENTEVAESNDGEKETPVDEQSEEVNPAEASEDEEAGEEEIPEEQAEEELPTRITLAAYGFKLSDHEAEYQPDGNHPINVEIRDPRITAEDGKSIELWHIKDDGTEERVEEFELTEGRIGFVSYGFSVYSIVLDNHDKYHPAGEAEAHTIADIDNHITSGFKIFTQAYNKGNPVANPPDDQFMGTDVKPDVRQSNRPGIHAIYTSGQAAIYYFEPDTTANNTTDKKSYYIYSYVPDQNGVTKKQYLKMTGSGDRGGLSFTENENEKTSITFRRETNGKGFFAYQSGPYYYWNRNINVSEQAANYGYIVGYKKDEKGDDNTALLKLYFQNDGYQDDPFDLDNKTCSIAYYEESVKASGLMSEANSTNGLEAAPLLVKPGILNQTTEMLVAEDNTLSAWTFDCISENKYRISTSVGGTKKYLKISSTGLELVEDNQTNPDQMLAGTIITVDNDPDSHYGKYRFSVTEGTDTYALVLKNGSANSGFASIKLTGNNDQYAWLTIADNVDLIDEDFQIYTAKKVSIAHHKTDPANDMVTDGDQLVIYTRVWNEQTKKYEHYAINHEGQMFRVYESGDTIQWVGSQVNTALWDFTVYYSKDGDGNFNYLKDNNGEFILDGNGEKIKIENLYYELQNAYSGQYLAPQYGNHIFQTGTLGIHLDGRSGGHDYSTITAWDDDNNTYVDLIGKEDTGNLATRKSNVLRPYYFYFAKMTTTNVVTKTTTVDTVNNSDHGIVMKMIDFNNGPGSRDPVQSQYFNGNDNGPGTLSVKLEGDYPVARHGNTRSLGSLYNGASNVNHLFIQSTYNNSGYFVYDSTQNYAYLPGGDAGGNFTVYDQLGTIKGRTSAFSSYHGQFFPYNDLINPATGEPWAYDETIFNTKDILGNELPDSDPRKGEGLHAIPQDQIDYFFAMEMTAGFTQTVSGEDAWGHDIIFEFSGDDDFWLYVDGDLVLDLGGVHSAMSGSVNFKTGEVKTSTNHGARIPVWNSTTGKVEYKYTGTLRQIFEANYRTTHPDCTFDEVEEYLNERFDGEVFIDYSTHEMRMFYMERGAGGSNLKMRFNLASVKPGHVILGKELSGIDYPVSSIGDFFFRIEYEDGDEGGTKVFDGINTTDTCVLKYESVDPVEYYDSIELGGVTYTNVYKLKAGEKADINMPDATIKYWITECGVDTSIFDHVYVNEEPITGVPSSENPYRAEFSTDRQSFNQRKTVLFDNHVDPNALGKLTITKNLFDETGETLITDLTPFTFRLYMGTENETLSDLSAASQIRYYVKKGDFYCKWDTSTKSYIVTDKKASDLHRNDDNPDDPNSWDYYVVHTSKYGSIAKIPAGYTVEIREILKNTKYKVEERGYEIPEGYTLMDYRLNENLTQETDDNPNALPQGSIVGGQTTAVEIENIKGYGFIMHKIWTDERFMLDRGDTYFALFKEDTIVPGTLKRLEYSPYNEESAQATEDDPFKQLRNMNTSLYWYLEKLNLGGSISDYQVYEVTLDDLTDPTTITVDSDGNVSGYSGTITRVINQKLEISGRQEGDTVGGVYKYDVSYERGAPGAVPFGLQSLIIQTEENTSTVRNNIRVDAVTNSREGITLYKQDMLGNPLEGAKFELVELNPNDQTIEVSKKTFTSNNTGLIAIAYLKEKTPYKLREISAPIGYVADENTDNNPSSYHGSDLAITLYLDTEAADGDVLKILDGDLNYIEDTSVASNPNPIIIIKNKKYTLRIKKTDAGGDPLSGVHFALYPQVDRSVNDVITPGRDYYPVAGFADLVTNGEGYVCYSVTENGTSVLKDIKEAFETGKLKPGTYYLHEKGTYSRTVNGQLIEYQPLPSDVVFTVSPTGTVTEYIAPDGTHGFPYGTTLSNPEPENNNVINYQINVKNEVAGENIVKVKKLVVDGTETDNGKSYEFTAKLYLPDKTTAWTFGKYGFTNGECNFSLTNNTEKTLTVPKGAILRIVESYNSSFETQYTVSLPEGITIPQDVAQKGQTCEITVPSSEDTTTEIVCTNTRIYTVRVRKILQDTFADAGTFVFMGTLTNYPESFVNPFIDENDQPVEIEMQVTNNQESFIDFRLPANARLKIEEVLTDPTVNNTYNAEYSTNTHETSSTVTVTDTFTEYSNTAPVIPIAKSDKTQIIEIRNTRKTKQVIIKKILNDATISTPTTFNFKATLYATDSSTPVEGCKLKYTVGTSTAENTLETHTKSDDPEENDTIDAGTFVITLTPQNGSDNNTAYWTLLDVPYDSYLEVEEIPALGTNYSTSINGYEGTSSKRHIVTDRTDETNTDPNTSVDDDDAFVFENKIEGKNLIITKSATGDMVQGGELFDFIVTGLGSNLTTESYTIYDEIYDANGKLIGTEAVAAPQTLVYNSTEGKLQFQLGHHQRIQIKGIPAQSNIQIAEADYTGCVPHYVIKRTTADGITTSVDKTDTVGHDISFSMDSHKKVEVRNDFPAVAPTGRTFHHTPFILLLIFGTFLLILGCGRKYRSKSAAEHHAQQVSIPVNKYDGKHTARGDPPATVSRQAAKQATGYSPGNGLTPDNVWVKDAPMCGGPPCPQMSSTYGQRTARPTAPLGIQASPLAKGPPGDDAG